MPRTIKQRRAVFKNGDTENDGDPTTSIPYGELPIPSRSRVTTNRKTNKFGSRLPSWKLLVSILGAVGVIAIAFLRLFPNNKLPIFVPKQSASSSSWTKNDKRITVSTSVFPLSIPSNKGLSFQEQTQQLEQDYEVIFHPAEQSLSQITSSTTTTNGNIKQIAVPKFWKDASRIRNYVTENNKGGLLTRAQALSIGSKVVPAKDKYYNTVYTSPIDGGSTEIDPYDDDGLVETIFVMIASYRDVECPHSVQSIFARAAFPERVRVAIVDQRDFTTDSSCYDTIQSYCDPSQQHVVVHDSQDVTQEESKLACKYIHQIDYYEMEAQYGVGPVFARHVGYRMYRGEYYTLQVDAHVFFVKEWDVQIVHQWKRTGNEMAILSTYLSDLQDNIDPITHMSMDFQRPIMCNTDFEGAFPRQYLRNGQQPENEPFVKGTPQLAPYWAAGFSFGRGHFVVNVPYDQYLPMVFQGEEINIGLRGFTYGYDYYAPEYSVCFHMYATGKNKKKRNKIKMFWEHEDRYPGVESRSLDRVIGITHMYSYEDLPKWDRTEENLYGLGTARDVHQFYKIYGIHIEEKTVEHHLCSFVNEGEMHPLFVRHLRPDGMGIDYTKIDYRFKDPRKKKED